MSTKESPLQRRPWHFERNYTRYAEGSVLVTCGHTKVLCNASVTEGVPRFLKGSGQGWLTAEYGMLPRSTHDRMGREAARGKQGGRTLEIQRLIGRSLRAAVDLDALGENTIAIDCDVIQADGGTRTAAISGSMVAVVDALRKMQREKIINTDPLKTMVAAISVGIHNGKVILDLDYQLDSTADTDMNVVMNAEGGFIEVQGTAENAAFTGQQLQAMLTQAQAGIEEIIELQKAALNNS